MPQWQKSKWQRHSITANGFHFDQVKDESGKVICTFHAHLHKPLAGEKVH